MSRTPHVDEAIMGTLFLNQSSCSVDGVICETFTALPTLCLTDAQAQRLWHLDAASCEEALALLVRTGFLRMTPDGRYCRADHPFSDRSSADCVTSTTLAFRVVDRAQVRPASHEVDERIVHEIFRLTAITRRNPHGPPEQVVVSLLEPRLVAVRGLGESEKHSGRPERPLSPLLELTPGVTSF